MKKWVVIGIAIVVGIGTGLGTGFVDVLKPYSLLTGAITTLVIVIIGLLRKPKEETPK